MYPWRRDEVDTDDLASAEVADEVEREDSEENVRSGEEYDEMAGVAGTEGEGEEARTAAGKASVSIDCRGSSIGICCGFGFRLECWIGVAAWSLGMFVTLTCGGLCATKSMLPRLSGLYKQINERTEV
jgi:hypothetical protein